MRRRSFLASLAAASVTGCQSSSSDGAFRHPDTVLVDQQMGIELVGVPPNTPITITTAAEDGRDFTPTWTASATVYSGDDGTVALADRSAVSGSYDGVDPMGLFWSMRIDAPAAEAFFPPQDHEVTLTARIDGQVVARSTIQRRLAADGVTAEPLDDGLVGTIYTPPDGASGPGVLLLAGSSRPALPARAKLLASYGFVTCALQYVGDPEPLPDILAAVPVEYAQGALDRLLAHRRVRGDQVGVWGVSKGAELALLLGSHDPRVGAVVGISPGTVVWEGFDENRRPAGTASWTIDGEPVPYVPLAAFEEVPGDPETSPRALYEYSQLRADPERIAAAAIPIERIDGPVRLFSGTDDNQWHSTAMADRAIDRLDEADHPYPHAHRPFEGAGHAMPIPYLPTYGASASPDYPLGGDPVANARASRGHWRAGVETLAGVDETFEAEASTVDRSMSSRSVGGPGERNLLLPMLAGGLGVAAVAALTALVAFGRRPVKASLVDGPIAAITGTAKWAWTRDESNEPTSRDTILFTSVLYLLALGLILLAGGALLAGGYRTAAFATLVFGIWFTAFVGAVNVGWEALKYRARRRAASTAALPDTGPDRELAPDLSVAQDTKIGFVVTIIALVVLVVSFRLAVALISTV